jgi:hypothetical protein
VSAPQSPIVGARPEATRLIGRGAARLMRSRGFSVVNEMTLANGRRADLVALAPNGEIVVVEVKSGLPDFRVDVKWPDYRLYCDRFFFAVAPDFPADVLPKEVGLILADSFGAEIVREAPTHGLVAARRKAVTLAFARHAAERLIALTDPYPDGR